MGMTCTKFRRRVMEDSTNFERRGKLDVPDEETCSEIFESFDVEGKGSLSMTQLEAAIGKALGRGFDDEEAIIKAAKLINVEDDGGLQRNEFELFLHCIAFQKNYYNVFCDGQRRNSKHLYVDSYEEKENNHSRISKEKFVSASSKLDIGNSDLLFHDIDNKNRGYVEFDEVCKYMAIYQCSKRYRSSYGCWRFSASPSSKLLAIARSGRQHNILTQCILDLRCCIDILHGNATDEDVEHIGCVVHECLSGDHRTLRNIYRVFEINRCADPYQTIASFFLDIVYYEVDSGLYPTVKEILEGVMDDKDEYCISKSMNRGSDVGIALVMYLFGYQPGEKLSPRCGMNKFLSACVASRMLNKILPLPKLVKVLVCIYSCNPYKKYKRPSISRRRSIRVRNLGNPTNPLELTPDSYLNAKTVQVDDQEQAMNICYHALLDANEEFDLGLSEGKIIKAVQRGVDLSNRQHGYSFNGDFECFIHDSWQFLPEISPALRVAKLYTVFDYHLGLQNLELQWRVMDPCRLFHKFRGVPNEFEMDHINRRATENVRLLRIYLHALIVSLSTVASFALLTGGDAPMSFFLGDQPTDTMCPTGHASASVGRSSSRHYSDQLGENFPIIPPDKLKVDCDRTVYDILINCRPCRQFSSQLSGDKFCLVKSPMTALLYGRMGTEGVEKALEFTDYPMEENRAWLLLKSLPKEIVFLIGKDIAKIAVSRTSMIEKILVELGHEGDYDACN